MVQPNFGENEHVTKFKDQSRLKTEFRLGCFETGTQGRREVWRLKFAKDNYKSQLMSYKWEKKESDNDRIGDGSSDSEEKKDNRNAYTG